MQVANSAVCILLIHRFGTIDKILAASRKDDMTSFGLPGGKVDPGEEPKTAAFRELQEETGIQLFNTNHFRDKLELAYTGMCCKPDGSQGFLTPCYFVTGELLLPRDFTRPEDLEGYQPMGEGILAWKTVYDLCSSGPFFDYNRRLFRHIGMSGS